MTPTRLALVLLFAAGCAPPGTVVLDPDSRALICEPLELGEGELRVKPVACTDELPRSSEGRTGDWLMQSSALRVVIRNPYEGLSLVGAPGGGVVDAVIPGWNDRFRELVPLVAGGALNPERVETGVDDEGAFVRLIGVSAAVPGLGGDEGVPGEIVYRLRADEPALHIEGADALYLHGGEDTEALGPSLYHEALAMISDGQVQRELGGAQVLSGASTLWIGTWPEIHELAWTGARASGSCAGDRVEVHNTDGQALAWLPPDFDSPLPPGAASLVCIAEGYADGEPSAPGEGLSLSTGAAGSLWVRAVSEEGVELPVLVLVDGEPAAVPPGGGAVHTGAGRFEVQVQRGPEWSGWSGAVEVSGDTFLELVLRPRMDVSGWMRVDLRRESQPSRFSAIDPSEDLALAAAQGLSFVVSAPYGEIGTPEPEGWVLSWLRAEPGTWSVSDAGASVWSWPWSSNRRYSGHGSPDPRGLSATDLLTLAMGPNDPNRVGLVSASWVEQAGEPSAWEPPPDLLALDSLDELDALITLLERGVPIGLVGPVTWTPADTRSLPSAAASQRGLIEGRSAIGTGPLLRLDAVGDDLPFGHHLRLRLEANADHAVDSLELWVDGAAVAEWQLTRGEGSLFDQELLVSGERWALLVVRGEDWAVSAPLWLGAAPQPPFGSP